jgi:hypothetical protein
MLEMGDRFEPINSEEAVVSIENSQVRVLVHEPMFKVGKLTQAMKFKILETSSSEWNASHTAPKRKWLDDGVECEILKPGNNWQKGKVRIKISLEFCPDEALEPPSPLDDIRRSLKAADS